MITQLEKYGVINSIVLSRSGESDNVYLRDEDSVAQNGLTEVKIVDNQIMNFNNRSDYLQGILNALNGLYYYLNDFNSTGILYYDVGDLYNVRIGENTYQCLMLNDEINVTTGIEEIIHTDMSEKSETDYSKADKTDRRINQTYLIVDKQNQEIGAVVKQTIDQTNPESTVNKVSKLNIRVGELESSIKDIADITTYGESDRAEVELKDINKSEPIMIKVHPTSTNISYLYPRENLYPSDTQYLPDRIIRFTRTYEEDGTTKTENIDYELPDDLLRYSDTIYDEFYLNYESQTCQVIKRCAYNADGTVRASGTEITTDYPYPIITLGEGNYTITLPGYDFGYLYVRLMAKNIYTTQFYTKVETDSRINQKANEINLGVNQTLTNYSTTNEMNSAITLKANEISSTVSKKVGEDEIISKINQSAEQVSISAKKVGLSGYATFTDLSTSGKTTISGDNITTGTLDASKINVINLNADNIKSGTISADKISGGTLDATLIKGNLDCNGYIRINHISFVGSSSQFNVNNGLTDLLGCGVISCKTIRYHTIEQISLKEKKKNFEKLDRALDKVLATDIYKYNFKFEKDTNKKHIGLVIGDGYNYSKEITNNDNNAVDLYSMIAVAYKAIQEQQEEIEELKKEIEKLKGGK